MNLCKLSLRIILVLLLIMTSRMVLASCSVSKFGYLNATFDTKTYTVGQNHAPGTTIDSFPVYDKNPDNSQYLAKMTCSTRNIYFYQQFVGGMSLSGYAGVYKTSVDGVGMRLTAIGGGTGVANTTASKWM